jgi:hypothetical protein
VHVGTQAPSERELLKLAFFLLKESVRKNLGGQHLGGLPKNFGGKAKTPGEMGFAGG